MDKKLKGILDQLDVDLTAEIPYIRGKAGVVSALQSYIDKKVHLACQEVRIETHKHHMYLAKSCVEANEEQLEKLKAEEV